MRSRIIFLFELVAFISLLVIRFGSESVVAFVENKIQVKTIMAFLLFLLIIDLLRRGLRFLYIRRNKLNTKQPDNFDFGINNIAKFLVGIGLIFSLFSFFGVDPLTLLTSLSIVAAALAIITKEYINDFLVGLYYSFARDFEINDYVQIGEHKGRIQELKMLKIKILNDDDDLVIIPNTKVYNNEIINYTKKDIRSLSIDFQIDIKAIKNLELLEEELIESLRGFGAFVEPDSFNLKIVDMKRDYIDLKFQYTLKHLNVELQKKIRKKTVRKVFNYISEKISN